jgi:tRNA wybutosine-synthesizing protein 4
VHEAQTENMSFQTKNFAYKTKDFETFMNEVHAGGRQYLRSLSSDQPTKLPAILAVDFPSLDGDFRLPEALSHVVENAHSSPLRISGPVTLWLHYDVSHLIRARTKSMEEFADIAPLTSGNGKRSLPNKR